MVVKIKFTSSEKYLISFPKVHLSLLVFIYEENCVFLLSAKIYNIPNNTL